MDICCPKCDFSRHVPDEAISPDMTIATCPKCGEKFRFKEQDNFSFSPLQEAAATESANTPEANKQQHSASTVEPQFAPATEQEGQQDAQLHVQPHSDESPTPPFASLPPNDQSENRSNEQTDENDNEEEETFLLPPDTPWGMIKEMGFFPAFATTIRAVLFAPRHLFAAMRTDTPFAMPFTFYLLASMVGVLFELIWQKTIGSPLLPAQLSAPEMTLNDFLMSLAFSPVALSVYLYLIGGLVHLCLMLTGGGKGGLTTTLRVLCYTSALDTLSIIPVVGSFIGGLWKLYTLAIGLRVAHNATRAQIIPAMLLLFLLLLVVVGSMLKSMGIF